MKSAEQIYEERVVVQTGFFQGAVHTLSAAEIIQLMKDYHAQFGKTQEELIDELREFDKASMPKNYSFEIGV